MNNSDFKKARQQLGLTQLQLAKKLGLTNRQIIRLEQDHPIQKQTELAINYLVTLSALDEQPYRWTNQRDIDATVSDPFCRRC